METSGGEYNFPEGEILLFDKPYGWTSFDLVGKVRNFLTRELKLKSLKVGHAGTLDPLATGLMILCTGKATKKVESLQAEEKEYVGTLKLGATTPSFDMETDEDSLYPAEHITQKKLTETLVKFTGTFDQLPPVFSAVKINGKRAYEHARAGRKPVLTPKTVTISEMELLSFEMPYATLRIVCSKGTYIRALVRDIGKDLHSGAYLTALRRTRSGNFFVEKALTFEQFRDKLASATQK
ncbi:MAG: tRNA pseudouridine(55) synthase TruB [Prolixibacteraceae bacterium]|nr:tRNA pseudouridine(55) synthase TruB [Prolixibacteraceae bacterium]HOR99676.1 tRNA pseudouridine(55) synthase TruB [Prolixibacteraceae bacterium]HOS89093.1 tRNA pseudouridine(55) synthase TruB [Prolixibacteraceae bacterium]HPL44279.1 tRNA pseudouridine(55) synthase TruB [Prolixibacteraceae bacterium]HQE50864.1 tRNA pseudouridine(55) synthase TruB [Prolixibacteraceae bacterium]